MATATRIYHINMEGVVHLVRASHPNAALMHVARNVASVRVASQDDLVNSLADGVKVESAKEEASENDPPTAPEPKSMPLWPTPTPIQLGDMARSACRRRMTPTKAKAKRKAGPRRTARPPAAFPSASASRPSTAAR